MTMSDPIADMLARIRNAAVAGHSSLRVPHSKIKEEIVKIMENEGYIEGYRLVGEGPQPDILINLKFIGKRKDRHVVLSGLERVSKPGRRIYTRASEIPWVRSGMGIAILSTPKGVLTGQQARRLGVGGEVLCYVW